MHSFKYSVLIRLFMANPAMNILSCCVLFLSVDPEGLFEYINDLTVTFCARAKQREHHSDRVDGQNESDCEGGRCNVPLLFVIDTSPKVESLCIILSNGEGQQ